MSKESKANTNEVIMRLAVDLEAAGIADSNDEAFEGLGNRIISVDVPATASRQQIEYYIKKLLEMVRDDAFYRGCQVQALASVHDDVRKVQQAIEKAESTKEKKDQELNVLLGRYVDEFDEFDFVPF